MFWSNSSHLLDERVCIKLSQVTDRCFCDSGEHMHTGRTQEPDDILASLVKILGWFLECTELAPDICK